MSLATQGFQDRPKLLLYLQYAVFGSAVLYFGREIFVPISFALLLSFVLYPSCAWLERKGFGRMTAVLVNLGLLSLVMFAVAALMVQQVLAFADEWPGLQEKIGASWPEMVQSLKNLLGVTAKQRDALLTRLFEELASGTVLLVKEAITMSAVSAVALILIPVYTVLILYHRHHWVKVLYQLFPSERNEDTRQILVLATQSYFNFIKGMGIVYLAVGVLNSIGLWILGVPHPFLFGFTASVLTFIPYVGILIGSILPITLAWTTHNSIWYAVGVAGVFTFVQYLEANIIFPVAVSNRLKVNTLVVLVAIFAGGILWGVAGMILFVPFVGIVKLIADHNQRMKTISMLLGS